MNNDNLSLKLPTKQNFLPVATSFVESSAKSLGLADDKSLALTLASEEIFMHISKAGRASNDLEIVCSKGSYFIRVDFLFDDHEFDLHVFNLTATISFDNEDDLDKMGLLLASRSVDRFEFVRERNHPARLTLIKEKTYPSFQAAPSITVKPMTEYAIRSPEPAEIKLFAELILQNYPIQSYPPFFRYPGKVADMIRGGDCNAVLALDSCGSIGGGIAWRREGLNTAESFGPYLFGQPPESPMGERLLEGCLNTLARTHCLNLVSRFAPPPWYRNHFEVLGSLTVWDGEEKREQQAYFRQMQEDPGCRVWCHPELKDFLKSEYKRLLLPREMVESTVQGEEQNKCAVLSTQIDRTTKSAVLFPVMPGSDDEKVLADHLTLFEKEGIRSIFFEMDLAVAWHSSFTHPLLSLGFIPRLIMPNFGSGDVVIFQMDANRL